MAEGVAFVEEKSRFRRDESGAGDRRFDHPAPAIEPAKAAAKGAADDALLQEFLALREPAIHRETSESRARASAARRAVVSFARAEHKVPRAIEEDDVIDLGETLRIRRTAQAPRELREHVHMSQIEALPVRLAEEKPVAAVGHVARDPTGLRHLDQHIFRLAK